MQKIIYLLGIYKKKIFFACSLVFFVFGLFSFLLINKKYNNESIIEHKNVLSLNDNTISKIKVDVKGAVKNPGVYELGSDSRVIDAVNMAGGLSDNAYDRNINLAKKIFDESVIIVNTNEEIEYFKLDKVPVVCENSKLLENNGICELYNIALIDNNNSSNNYSSNESVNTFVNINNASIDELSNLEGIGKSKAEKIIEYRDSHNGFKNISELLNVEGIGEKLYEAIKNNITI